MAVDDFESVASPQDRPEYPERARTIGMMLIDREADQGDLSFAVAWAAKRMLERAYQIGPQKGFEIAHARLFAWLDVTVGDDTSSDTVVDLEGKETADRMDDIARVLHQEALAHEAADGVVMSAGQVVDEFATMVALADVVAQQEAHTHAEPQRLGSTTMTDLIAA